MEIGLAGLGEMKPIFIWKHTNNRKKITRRSFANNYTLNQITLESIWIVSNNLRFEMNLHVSALYVAQFFFLPSRFYFVIESESAKSFLNEWHGIWGICMNVCVCVSWWAWLLTTVKYYFLRNKIINDDSTPMTLF